MKSPVKVGVAFRMKNGVFRKIISSRPKPDEKADIRRMAAAEQPSQSKRRKYNCLPNISRWRLRAPPTLFLNALSILCRFRSFARSTMRCVSPFSSSFGRKGVVLRKTTFRRVYTLAALSAGLSSKFGILRKAAFFVRNALSSLSSDGSLFFGIHRSKAPA